MVEGSAEAAMVAGIHEGSEEGEEDKGDRSFGGNRWPRHETLALLKIRSDMDSVFRDSTLKGPLWEEVSRKLAELGYHRSAKKCKEKFENVYKYHKRTKDGRTTNKTDGKAKAYRFFDQLEAFQNNLRYSLLPSTPTSASMVHPTNNNATLPSINPTVSNSTQAVPVHSINPCYFNISSNIFSTSTSSSTTSNDDAYRRISGKKRKWKVFFRRLTKEVIEKQEELQNKFLQTIEKYEQQRIAREEAWRVQEMAQINKEHEILVQERSKAAAKDAAVLAFLQKIISGHQPNTVQENHTPDPSPPPPPTVAASLSPPPLLQQPKPPQPMSTNGGNNVVPISISASRSRWPKAEVEALIKLRTDLNIKYHENGPKGPLWEEISTAMRNLGYNRSSKRCKEKWENINKYFKKVKENNKSRPEDSKTCPYFHQLDAIYKQKTSKSDNSSTTVPLMVRPEQQWHPPPEKDSYQAEAAMMEEDGDDDTEEDEYEGNDYELVAKTAPVGNGGE